MSRSLQALAAIVLALLPAGCFLPTGFTARVTVAADGAWHASYDGTLVFVPGVDALADAPDRAAVLARADAPAQDLALTDGVTGVDHIGEFRYRVAFDRSGDIGETLRDGRLVLLGPRARFLVISPEQGGVIEIRGGAVAGTDAAVLDRLGLAVQGRLEIRVDGDVLAHNAHTVRDGVWIWQFRGLDSPAPYLVFRLDGS